MGSRRSRALRLFLLFPILSACLSFVSITSKPSTALHRRHILYSGASSSAQQSPAEKSRKLRPKKVLITGAGKKDGNGVGYLVFQKLLKRKEFEPIGVCRDKSGKRSLLKLGATEDQVRLADIREKSSISGIFYERKDEKSKIEKVVICESARAKKKLGRKLKDFLKKYVLRQEVVLKKPSDLYYKKGESPYQIDYVGAKNVIDAAMEPTNSKVDHIVLLGSMGGYIGSKLNEVGRKKDETDNKVGNLLNWRRATERYLMKRCFFTIVHAGTFTDEPGGKREIVWDIDDALLRTNFRRIPKEDAAEVLVQALIHKDLMGAQGKSIDVASRPASSTNTVKPYKNDWVRFWSISGSCTYPGK